MCGFSYFLLVSWQWENTTSCKAGLRDEWVADAKLQGYRNPISVGLILKIFSNLNFFKGMWTIFMMSDGAMLFYVVMKHSDHYCLCCKSHEKRVKVKNCKIVIYQNLKNVQKCRTMTNTTVHVSLPQTKHSSFYLKQRLIIWLKKTVSTRTLVGHAWYTTILCDWYNSDIIAEAKLDNPGFPLIVANV